MNKTVHIREVINGFLVSYTPSEATVPDDPFRYSQKEYVFSTFEEVMSFLKGEMG